MRPWLAWLSAGVAAILLIAALFVYFGVYNVAATTGHTQPVSWLLHTTMQHSVSLRAPGDVPVDLSDMKRVRLGAGHFATVCVRCHSAPGAQARALGRAMTPEPPHFEVLTERWTPQELFWIVNHGIKMTGMPAWPAPERTDEVWSVVAFLTHPGRHEPEEYRRLAFGPDWPASADPLLANCARCHGFDGSGRDMEKLPVIGGQKADYLSNALHAFRSGDRPSGIMQTIAAGLTDAEIDRLARHYGAQAPASRGGEDNPDLIARGAELARNGMPARKVPACSACHGPWPERTNSAYPEIRGQPAAYIEKQLQLFRDGKRAGTPYSHLMLEVADDLSDQDIKALAAYYASEQPDTATAMRP